MSGRAGCALFVILFITLFRVTPSFASDKLECVTKDDATPKLVDERGLRFLVMTNFGTDARKVDKCLQQVIRNSPTTAHNTVAFNFSWHYAGDNSEIASGSIPACDIGSQCICERCQLGIETIAKQIEAIEVPTTIRFGWRAPDSPDQQYTRQLSALFPQKIDGFPISRGITSKLGPTLNNIIEYPRVIKTIVSGFVTAHDGTQLSIRLSFVTTVSKLGNSLSTSSHVEQIDDYTASGSMPNFRIFPIDDVINKRHSFDTSDKMVAIAWDAMRDSVPNMSLDKVGSSNIKSITGVMESHVAIRFKGSVVLRVGVPTYSFDRG